MKFIQQLTLLTVCLTSLWVLPQSGNFRVDLQLLNANAQIFPIGDFDFVRSGLVDPYYIVEIENQSESVFDLRLCLEVRYNGEIIATSESDIIQQVPFGQQYMLTSQTINLGVASINGSPVRFQNTVVDYGAVEELEQQVLSTGRAPSGLYEVRMFYSDNTTGLNCAAALLTDPNLGDNRMVITNPTTLEPVFPGRSVSEGDIDEVNTLFPFFQWQSDINPGSFSSSENPDDPPFFTLQVYEKFPEDITTDDVLSHPPVLHVDKYKLNFLQYPPESSPVLLSGTAVGPVRLLSPGNTYYWRVTSTVPTAIGSVNLESDVFRFKVAETATAGNNSNLILLILQQMLGPRYELVNSELLEKGFEPNGEISLEGRNADIADLIQFLNAVVQGTATIKTVEVY